MRNLSPKNPSGEDIHVAAVREVCCGSLDVSLSLLFKVKEETGIDTVFESVICYRTHHEYRFGMYAAPALPLRAVNNPIRSDIYFVCKLRPLSNTIKAQVSFSLWHSTANSLAGE
jgi:hypothetical protein